MELLTLYQIAELAENEKRWETFINKQFLKQDESHLWPIRGKFNATKRAIGRAKRFIRDTGELNCPLSYALFLDDEISRIVNGVI